MCSRLFPGRFFYLPEQEPEVDHGDVVGGILPLSELPDELVAVLPEVRLEVVHEVGRQDAAVLLDGALPDETAGLAPEPPVEDVEGKPVALRRLYEVDAGGYGEGVVDLPPTSPPAGHPVQVEDFRRIHVIVPPGDDGVRGTQINGNAGSFHWIGRISGLFKLKEQQNSCEDSGAPGRWQALFIIIPLTAERAFSRGRVAAQSAGPGERSPASRACRRHRSFQAAPRSCRRYRH